MPRAIGPSIPPAHEPSLSDLVRLTPGDEGKWFAAAKDARLFDEAIALANQTPCDPKTLTRAARDSAGRSYSSHGAKTALTMTSSR